MKKIPLISIVGRPNVGKSSLFNVLLKRKQSLVAPVSGVTRDVVEALWTWEDWKGEKYEWELRDTGGMSQTLSHDFSEQTMFHAKRALQEADLILFVVDGRRGITHDDAVIAEELRKTKFDQVYIVVNKIDDPRHEEEARQEFQSFGFPHVFFISCAHRGGIASLQESVAEYIKARFIPLIVESSAKSQEEQKEGLEVSCTLLGKPNAGKSSFFNRVLGKDRSIISDIAGTTRDVLSDFIVYKGKTFRFFDTAGFRRRTKVVESLEQDSIKKALWAIRKSEVVVLLIDASLGSVTEQDKKLLELIIKEKRGVVVALNKWDLISSSDRKLWKDRMSFFLKEAKYFPILTLSTLEGQGVWKVLDTVWRVKENYHHKIKAKELTNFLKEKVKEKPPFSKLGMLKIYYASQVRQTPPEFEIFVNNEKILTPSYERSLIASLYEAFPLEGVPFQLVFKNRR